MSEHLVEPVVSGMLSLEPGARAVAMEIVVHHTNTPVVIRTARIGTPEQQNITITVVT